MSNLPHSGHPRKVPISETFAKKEAYQAHGSFGKDCFISSCLYHLFLDHSFCRKSQEYQFPKTAGGRKRLRAGLKKINKLGGDLDEPWCSVSISIFNSFSIAPFISRKLVHFKDCRFRSVQDHRLRSFEKVPRKAKLWFAAWLNGFQFSFIHLATRFQNIFSKLANFGSDFQHLRVPCLTRARAGVDAFWATSHGRFLTLKDWNFLSKTVYSNVERLKVSNVSFCKIGIENSLLLSNRLGKSGPSRMVDFGQRCWGSFGEAIWNGSGKCLANSSGSADPSPARPSYGLVRMRSKKRWEKRKGGDPRKETSYKFHNISPFELQYIIICSPI